MNSALAQRQAQRQATRAQTREKVLALHAEAASSPLTCEGLKKAVRILVAAIESYGHDSTSYTNLAVALLRLGLFQDASQATDLALIADPRSGRARVHRAIARRGLKQWGAARRDLEVVLGHDPKCGLARNELISLERYMSTVPVLEEADAVDSVPTRNLEWPPDDQAPFEYDYDSDSEDARHSGNNTQCRFYNHEGCSPTKGRACKFSHAPDFRSVRDRLGRNVCIAHLLGVCQPTNKRFGCNYSHDQTHLEHPEWWNFGDRLDEARRLFAVASASTSYSIDPFQSLIDKFPAARVIAKELVLLQRRQRLRRILETVNEHPSSTPTLSPSSETLPAPNFKNTPNGPLVVALLGPGDLFLHLFSGQLSALKQHAPRLYIVTNPVLFDVHLDAACARGIYLADAGVTDSSDANLLPKLVNYVRSGGHVVAGGVFPSMARPLYAARFFSAFGLRWDVRTTARAEYEVVPYSEIACTNPSLPESYTMSALNLQGFSQEDQLYTPVPDDDRDSDDFQVFLRPPSARIGRPKPSKDAPILRSRVGRGSLAYIGDLNGEEETSKVLRAMFGLLDPQRVGPPVRKSKPFVIFLSFGRMDFYGTEEVYGSFLRKLKETVEVVSDLSTERMAELMDSPDLVAVLVPSAAIASPSEAYILSKLASFTNDRGGLVVFMDQFASHIAFPECRPLFLDSWGLDWKTFSSSYDLVRAQVGLNERNAAVIQGGFRTSLQEIDFSSAHTMSSSNPDDIVVIPKGASTRGRYWDTGSKRYAGPVLYARTGGNNGRVAFVGDIKPRDELVRVVHGLMFSGSQ